MTLVFIVAGLLVVLAIVRAARAQAVIVGVAAVVAVVWLVRDEVPVIRMLAIVATTFLAMKVVVLADAPLPLARRLAFVSWFGMRPSDFAKDVAIDVDGGRALLVHGFGAATIGAAMLLVAQHVPERLVATLLAFVAISLVLHFGTFDVLAGVYRLSGIPVRKLFRAPLRARSLTEFWSRRWNTGFSEMIALFVDRPLRGRVPPTFALLASFLASGLLHELAISVPVRAGYGLPTAYFLLHGGLVAYEKHSGRTPGRAWTLFWLAAPLPLVFHPPFVRGVVWPLAGLG